MVNNIPELRKGKKFFFCFSSCFIRDTWSPCKINKKIKKMKKRHYTKTDVREVLLRTYVPGAFNKTRNTTKAAFPRQSCSLIAKTNAMHRRMSFGKSWNRDRKPSRTSLTSSHKRQDPRIRPARVNSTSRKSHELRYWNQPR